MTVCIIFGSLDDPLQICDTNIISHHVLHAIEPFEAFHPLMFKANDLVQAFRDRQEILAQAPHGEFPSWWSWWHEDIKCVLTIWLICLSLWNCYAFVAREFWWLRRICGNCWVFWLDFDHFPSLMQAAAVKQEIKEELLQEIVRLVRYRSPFWTSFYSYLLLENLVCIDGLWLWNMSNKCPPQKVYLKVVSALAQSYFRHVKSSAVSLQWRVQRETFNFQTKESERQPAWCAWIGTATSALAEVAFILCLYAVGFGVTQPVGVKGSSKLCFIAFRLRRKAPSTNGSFGADWLQTFSNWSDKTL